MLDVETEIVVPLSCARQRSWQKAPFIGPQTARFSRVYFTTAALVLGAFSSAYAYARSPFTMLCGCDDKNVCSLTKTRAFTNVRLLSGDSVDGVITTSEEQFYFCNQKNIGFPPIPIKQGSNTWMTAGQERISKLYGWVCLILLIVYVVIVLGQRIVRSILSLWKGVYKVRSSTK